MIKHKGYAKKFAKFNLRYGRGNGHLSFILNAFKMVVYYGGFSYIMNDWFGFTLPKAVGIIFVVGYMMACYIIGWIDEKIGFWKQEATYGIEELNPPLRKVTEQVEEILKYIKK